MMPTSCTAAGCASCFEQYAAAVPGFFLYFPSRAQVSPALSTTPSSAPRWPTALRKGMSFGVASERIHLLYAAGS
jgi:hypothetical protein